VLVTAAVDADVPLRGRRYAVELGRVTPAAAPRALEPRGGTQGHGS
jgi:hypothetical protein